MLHDRIVCGINDAQTQKRLLAEKNLTFVKAREIALALEIVLQGSKDELFRAPYHRKREIQFRGCPPDRLNLGTCI